MNNLLRRLVQWLCCVYFVSITLASASQIQDDFGGVSLDQTLWGSANTGGASVPMQAVGELTTHVVTNSQNQRSLIYSVRTNLNFTIKPLTMSAKIARLGGEGSVTYPVNRYLLIGSFGKGTENLSRYYPGTELPLGVWLLAGQTNGVNYLEVGTVRLGNVTTTREIYTGVLTSMSLTLHGSLFTVNASGTGSFSVGVKNSFTGKLANLHAWEYHDHFRFAMGSANSYQGAVTEGASAGWDSVTVTPDPGSAP